MELGLFILQAEDVFQMGIPANPVILAEDKSIRENTESVRLK
jgi:hypothetical protein